MTKVAKSVKQRNWVAKNMLGKNAKHKDKRKEEKLGKFKHKSSLLDF